MVYVAGCVYIWRTGMITTLANELILWLDWIASVVGPTLFPLFNSGANAAPASVQALMFAGPAIETLCVSRHPQLSCCYSGDYPTRG